MVDKESISAKIKIQSVTAERVNSDLARGRTMQITVNNQTVECFEGETVAVAMITSQGPDFCTSSRLCALRGLYCGIGVCFDCTVTIDGRPNVRACQTPVRDGMQVQSQEGLGVWRLS